MKRLIFLLAVCMATAIGAKAQTGKETGTTHGKGADSLRCLENLSLFDSYARSKNYKEAYPFWKIAYEECPAAHVNIYIAGVNIINWLISQETDPAKIDALVDDMMKLFDDRLLYFPNDQRTRKDEVIARKAVAYNNMKGDNTDYNLMYKWTGEAIEEFGENSFPMAVSRYMFASFKLMQSDTENHKEKYINDFLNCSNIFDALYAEAVAANKKEEDINNILGYKAEMDQNFFASGVADCDILQEIYTPKIEDNKNNLEFLKQTMILFRRLNCNETDIFITISEYAYKIEPTAESAMGLGLKAYKDKDLVTAEKYYNEAIAMSDNAETKAKLYYTIASMALQQNQFQKAKQLSLRCLSENPNFGRAYMLIGQAYGVGGRNIYPDDAVLSRCIYYAIVEKLEKARQVDPSIAGEVNTLINQYSKSFPTKEDIFMHPDLESGLSFTIGGWINETVKIR